MKNKIQISKRMRLKLKDSEFKELKEFCATVYGAYATITGSTGITYDTMQRLFDKGSAERDVIFKLRTLLNQLKESGIITKTDDATNSDGNS